MNKKIIHKEELRGHILKGVNTLADIVGVTLGPGGLPVVIERVGQALNGTPLSPKITKDGVSVANECVGNTPEEDVIVQTVKDICKKTNKDTGDGTTTAIVLGRALLKLALRHIESEPYISPQQIKRELEVAGLEALAHLEDLAVDVTSSDMIEKVATISANGDVEIGKIIAEAFHKVGVEGVVTVDQGGGEDVTLTVVEGYQFDRGAQSRQNFFNNKDLTAFEGEKVAVAIFDGAIRSHTDVIPLMMMLADVDQATGQPGKPFPPLVLIANEFSVDVLQFLLIQKAEQGLPICPVIGPNVAHIRTGYYDDLAAYTGGIRMGNGRISLSQATHKHIGLVAKAKVSTYHTTLYGGGGEEEAILARVEQLSALREQAESPFDRQGLNDRVAALTNGIAKIGVGGATEVEVLEKYDRIEDALNAARAALQEGVVPGGGAALAYYSKQLGKKEFMNAGEAVLRGALLAPFTQIIQNAGEAKVVGFDLMEQVIQDLGNADGKGVYDVETRKFMPNALEAGIIDPVKVTKAALKNALSVAGLLITAGGSVIYNKKN